MYGIGSKQYRVDSGRGTDRIGRGGAGCKKYMEKEEGRGLLRLRGRLQRLYGSVSE